MKHLLFYSISIFIVIVGIMSCNTVNEKISDVSEKAGKTAGEIAKGVTTGVESAYVLKVDLSETLKKQGIELGKISLHDSAGTDNKLSVYMIFNNDFKGVVTVKAFEKGGLEMGRVNSTIDAKKSEARFVDFVFDPRTNIDSDSKIMME